jgi:hypothetical protein
MVRAFIVWCSCIVLALLGITGAHGHRSLSDAGSQPAHQAHENASIFQLAASFLNLDSPAHEHGHAEHGNVDVEPPVKARGKAPASFAVDLIILLGIGVVICILRLASTWAPLAPRDRPPSKRRHPFQLPPSQAPPRTA